MFEKPELLFLQSLGSKEAMHRSVSLLHRSRHRTVEMLQGLAYSQR